MKILLLADQESKKYWDYFDREDFRDIELIISCGDLKGSYLSFLTTMTAIPVLYVNGNHDKYDQFPPEGCICIEDKIYTFQGIRIMGLGGSMRYRKGANQYTEREMRKRVRKMRWRLFFEGGFDILVAHAPARGLHDGNDLCHQGFQTFIDLIDRYHPMYFVHGHMHLSYGYHLPRVDQIGSTTVVNAYEKHIIEI